VRANVGAPSFLVLQNTTANADRLHTRCKRGLCPSHHRRATNGLPETGRGGFCAPKSDLEKPGTFPASQVVLARPHTTWDRPRLENAERWLARDRAETSAPDLSLHCGC